MSSIGGAIFAGLGEGMIQAANFQKAKLLEEWRNEQDLEAYQKKLDMKGDAKGRSRSGRGIAAATGGGVTAKTRDKLAKAYASTYDADDPDAPSWEAYLQEAIPLLGNGIGVEETKLRLSQRWTPGYTETVDPPGLFNKHTVDRPGSFEAPPSPDESLSSIPPSTNIPPAAIRALRENPDLQKDFDLKYGAGAAASVLGG